MAVSKSEKATAWLVAYLDRARSEKITTKAADGTKSTDLQRTIFFLVQCGVQAIMKLRVLFCQTTSLVINEIHNVIRDFCRPRANVVDAERALFLSTVQNQGKSEDDVLRGLSKAAQ